jgi:hypothetical protein
VRAVISEYRLESGALVDFIIKKTKVRPGCPTGRRNSGSPSAIAELTP